MNVAKFFVLLSIIVSCFVSLSAAVQLTSANANKTLLLSGDLVLEGNVYSNQSGAETVMAFVEEKFDNLTSLIVDLSTLVLDLQNELVTVKNSVSQVAQASPYPTIDPTNSFYLGSVANQQGLTNIDATCTTAFTDPADNAHVCRWAEFEYLYTDIEDSLTGDAWVYEPPFMYSGAGHIPIRVDLGKLGGDFAPPEDGDDCSGWNTNSQYFNGYVYKAYFSGHPTSVTQAYRKIRTETCEQNNHVICCGGPLVV